MTEEALTETKVYRFPIVNQVTIVQLQLPRPGRLRFIHCDDERAIVTKLFYANIDGLYPKEQLPIKYFINNELAAPILTRPNYFHAEITISADTVRLKPKPREVIFSCLILTEFGEISERAKESIICPVSKKMLDFWCGSVDRGMKGGPFIKDFES